MGKNTVVIDKTELEELKKAARNLAEENAQLRQKLDRMNELFANAQRTRFGQSSEKTKYVMQSGTQLGLFDEAEAEGITRRLSQQRTPLSSPNIPANPSARWMS